MSEPLIAIPPGGWTTDDLDELPVSNYRYELTDGALSVSPSPSNLHQALSARLFAALEDVTPEPFAVAMAVDIRFGRQLTRIPDLMLIRSDEPARHWFAPAEVIVAIEIESPGNHVEDRTTKPALYAQFGIPYYWRIEPAPSRVTIYQHGHGDAYVAAGSGERLTVTEPFPVDLNLAALLPRWAR
ncbi:Uma2 family endonuclease [Protofrankia symbiont of Coriaria ruscifolia]|uniref:Uma2 family endonuclease n=1 Tax=Protofrankia symbiont of Coriaria ruscifolia TaxID=1306542 RepID=UPI00104106A5|nr:Uma2 family endonuclease [Protofrankia symbiont of Coriaria ruscifolia]